MNMTVSKSKLCNVYKEKVISVTMRDLTAIYKRQTAIYKVTDRNQCAYVFHCFSFRVRLAFFKFWEGRWTLSYVNSITCAVFTCWLVNLNFLKECDIHVHKIGRAHV